MQRLFYATAEDLLPVFQKVEIKHKLAYTLKSPTGFPALTSVSSGSAIATLASPAPSPKASAGYSYLVTPADVQIITREVPQQVGRKRVTVDQAMNPMSITLEHGGFYKPDILLYGRVANSSGHPIATALYHAFASAIATCFVRVHAYYVGPKAAELLHRGGRLTIGADSPRDFDLAYHDPA